MTPQSSRSRSQVPGPAEAGPPSGRRRGRRRGADPAPYPCPYLHAGGDDGDSVTLEDRCRAGEQPIRVGEVYLTAVCRTASYRSCPRFADAARAMRATPPGAATQGRRRLPRSGIPSIVPDANWPAESPRPAGRAMASPSGAVDRPIRSKKARRRASIAELMVIGLGVSILFACLFVGYAVMYRVQLRRGIEVAAGPPRVPVSASLPGRTPVPTFTPTPLPTTPSQAAASATPMLPAPEPQPTRPLPTPMVRPPAVSPPTRVVIPKIEVDVEVIPVGLRIATIAGKQRVVWSDVANAAAFHETSAYPGNAGNTVINGHRDILGSVFRHLDRLEAGDEVIVYVGDVPYPYFVTETLVVPDTFASHEQRVENAKLIGDFPEERLTLVTCTPVGLATHRLVVIAKPLLTSVPRMPNAGWSPGP